MAAGTITTRTDLDPDHIRELIVAERDRLQEQLRKLREQDRSGGGGDQSNELADHDQHDADQGTELFLREQDEALVTQFRGELEALNAAEHRLETGAFGFCERCKVPIPADRLELLPFATLCVGCAQELEGM